MKRRARDGRAYDLFEFTVWYDGGLEPGVIRRAQAYEFDFAVWYDGGRRARELWREAPPLYEQHSRREIALEEMLTRSALRMLDSR